MMVLDVKFLELRREPQLFSFSPNMAQFLSNIKLNMLPRNVQELYCAMLNQLIVSYGPRQGCVNTQVN